ncbi:xylulokinase [Candidatus Bipolaricaulota bacterium]|nr:xylulokinase [Candidatus Bipolaricaulota bacterium]MBS3792631.1 xylulokinase [Candidatus Bipolaricaulota bacterium]
MSILIGLDVGTSRTKSLVINSRGELVAASSLDNYSTKFPESSWAEQDPSKWWEAVKGVLSDTVNGDNIDPGEIAGIGLTGQMHGPVFLDKKGSPLCPCMIWSDTRAKQESQSISRLVPEISEITGNPVSSGFTAPKVLWLKKNRPEIFEKIWKIVLPKDYINYKLTGSLFTDPSDASGTLLFDIQEGRWSNEILNQLEIRKEMLPSIANSTSIAGELKPEVASELGMPEGIPVVVGGGDLATGLIGNGAVKEGSAAITIGTAGQVLVPVGELGEDFLTELYSFRTPDFEGFFTLGTVPSGGLSLQWFKDSVSKVEDLVGDKGNSLDSFDLLSKQAARIPAGSNGLIFLPYLMGTGNPHMDYRAKGGFLGLTPDHGKGEMIRSIMEGVTMALKESLEVTERWTRIDDIRLGAGATNSQVWNQIQADIYGREVQLVNVNDPSPFGAALLAGVGLDMFSGIAGATDQAVKVTSRIKPDRVRSRKYEELSKVYRETYQALAKVFPKLEAF